MAQILESLHRADRAVVVLQDALKGSANAVDPATTRGHELTHGASVLQLASADRRKFEDMLASAQVGAAGGPPGRCCSTSASPQHTCVSPTLSYNEVMPPVAAHQTTALCCLSGLACFVHA